MRTKLISSKMTELRPHVGGVRIVEELRYECPCGEGVVEEDRYDGGTDEVDLALTCVKCAEVWTFSEGRDLVDWELVEVRPEPLPTAQFP